METITKLSIGTKLHIFHSFYIVTAINRDQRTNKFIADEYVLQFEGFDDEMKEKFSPALLRGARESSSFVVRLPWKVNDLKSIT